MDHFFPLDLHKKLGTCQDNCWVCFSTPGADGNDQVPPPRPPPPRRRRAQRKENQRKAQLANALEIVLTKGNSRIISENIGFGRSLMIIIVSSSIITLIIIGIIVIIIIIVVFVIPKSDVTKSTLLSPHIELGLKARNDIRLINKIQLINST